MTRERISIEPNLTIKEIVEKYHVSRATAYRAQKRCYFFRNTDTTEHASEAEQRGYIHICSMKEINKSAFIIRVHKYFDILAEKATLTQQEAKWFYDEIATTIGQLDKFLSDPSAETFKKHIIDNKVIKHYVMFDKFRTILTNAAQRGILNDFQLEHSQRVVKSLRDDLDVEIRKIRNP